jgi:transketolase
MYIAEQQMVAAAVGMQILGWKPFASTFAAFMSRAYDFVRMAAISRATIKLCGSHAGVSIGEDGPSQMALEDLAEFRAVHGSTVLYPCDGNQTAKLVRAMADIDGILFLRTTRADTPVLYDADEEFPVGGSKVVHSTAEDDVAIVAAGDHWAEGGLGDAVLDTLADLESRPPVIKLAVREMPHSGKPAELLAAAGIDAEHIADAARRLVRERAPA